MPEKEENLGDGEWNPASHEDMKHVFPKVEIKPADPVGIPLPFKYNDNPTIPPAYNATCIKSQFFDENDPEAFARSIRDSPDWPKIRKDPVFKRYSDMIMRRFENSEHEYATYILSPPPSPSVPIKIPPPFKFDRSSYQTSRVVTPERDTDMIPRNTHTSSNSRDYLSPGMYHNRDSPSRPPRHSQSRGGRWPSKRSHENSPDRPPSDHRDFKRAKLSEPRRDTPRSNSDRPTSPPRRTPSPVLPVDGNHWSPQAGETETKAVNDYRYLDVPNTSDGKFSSPRVPLSKIRNDSGYHSGQSVEKGVYSNRGREDERDDVRQRVERDRSFQRRRSPLPSRSRSRSQISTSGASNRSRSESPLTALEAGLLGLADEDTVDDDQVAKKTPKKPPIKRVKVAAAFR